MEPPPCTRAPLESPSTSAEEACVVHLRGVRAQGTRGGTQKAPACAIQQVGHAGVAVEEHARRGPRAADRGRRARPAPLRIRMGASDATRAKFAIVRVECGPQPCQHTPAEGWL